MSLLVALFGLFIAAVGLWGFIFPGYFLAQARRFVDSPQGVYWIIALRLALGCFLLMVAADSRFPTTMYVLGVVALFAAVMTATMGRSNIERYMNWWVKQPEVYLRIPMLIGWVLGVFIVYAVI